VLLEPYDADLVVLCGYLHILTAPMLDRYRDRLVNVHDGDLTVLDADGRPRWRGLRSTRDAMLAGAGETRSVVHLVTEEVDLGPVLLRSRPFPVRQTSASAQRDWMMRTAWGPLLARTIYLFARPVASGR
jgi:folate-dependent phosphoribosylglycinamide formyltransferase PurN